MAHATRKGDTPLSTADDVPIEDRPTALQDGQPTPVSKIRGATTVASDLAAIASGRVGSAFLSFVTALFTTRLLGPSGYGTLAVVGVLSTLVFTASAAWTGTSVRRYGREDFELRGRMNRLTWNRAVIGAPLIVVSVSLVVLLKLFGALPAALTWELVWIGLATAGLQLISDHWTCLLETSGNMKVSAATQVARQALYVAALVAVFVLGLRTSPAVVLLLGLGSMVVFVLIVAPIVWRVGMLPVAGDRELLRRMLWLSTPLIGLVVGQYVISSVDIIVLRMFRSQADVGVYAVAYQAYSVLTAAAASATPVLVPLFVSLRLAGRQNLIERYLRHVVPQALFLGSLLTGVAVPVLPLALPVVYGSRFSAASSVLAVLTIGLVFLFATFAISPILTLYEQARATGTINGIAAAVNVVGDLLTVGVFHLGIIAPAIVTSLTLILFFVMFHARACRILETDARPQLALAAPLVAGLTPTLAFGGLVGAVSGVAAAVATSAAILKWRSPFYREDAEWIEKLRLPDPVKRAALKAIAVVS